MTTQCTLYTFRADAPNGIIQVARVTTYQATSKHDHDVMVDFPERFMEGEPRCLELESMAGVVFVDDRDIDSQEERK